MSYTSSHSSDNGTFTCLATTSNASSSADLEARLTHRKRVRRNSDSAPDSQYHLERPPEKMSKFQGQDDRGRPYNTANAEMAMDGLICSPSTQDTINRKRDETYYIEDGSCVLLVSDTLFNVHRSILCKDSSSFGAMFSLPQGARQVEGRSDDNPIVLTGNTPEEFRHFLWALYALPPELQIVMTPEVDLKPLIDIARVSHKYEFKSLETWALNAIHDYVSRKPCPIRSGIASPDAGSGTTPSPAASQPSLTSPTPADLLSSLVRLAQLCQHERLLSTVITLLRQLMTTSVHYAHLAMCLADELDLRVLRGAAYLEVMQKAAVVSGVAGVLNLGVAVGVGAGASLTQSVDALPENASTPPIRITRAQQLRLLSGYYRLTSTWDALRLTPLAFEHSHSCSATWHQTGCTQSWLEFWKEKTRSDGVMALGLADVLGRLRLVQKDYERWGSATYMHHDCRILAKRAIGEVVARVEEALPDYFADPGGCDD